MFFRVLFRAVKVNSGSDPYVVWKNVRVWERERICFLSGLISQHASLSWKEEILFRICSPCSTCTFAHLDCLPDLWGLDYRPSSYALLYLETWLWGVYKLSNPITRVSTLQDITIIGFQHIEALSLCSPAGETVPSKLTPVNPKLHFIQEDLN